MCLNPKRGSARQFIPHVISRRLHFTRDPPSKLKSICHEHQERLGSRYPHTARNFQGLERVDSRQRSRLFCSSFPPVSPDLILISSLETPNHKENYDPFLVKSPPLPPRGDHVATVNISSRWSHEVWNLLRIRHFLTPSFPPDAARVL